MIYPPRHHPFAPVASGFSFLGHLNHQQGRPSRNTLNHPVTTTHPTNLQTSPKQPTTNPFLAALQNRQLHPSNLANHHPAHDTDVEMPDAAAPPDMNALIQAFEVFDLNDADIDMTEAPPLVSKSSTISSMFRSHFSAVAGGRRGRGSGSHATTHLPVMMDLDDDDVAPLVQSCRTKHKSNSGRR